MSDILRLPKGSSEGGLFSLELTEVHKLEARKVETACVTKSKAPELMHAMEQGYSIVSTKLLPVVAYELSQARQAADERKAVVMLDEAPRILQEKGLATSRNPSGSEGQRESVLAMDEEYKLLQDKVEMLKATFELLKGKLRGFEMSFSTVKKVFDSLNQYGSMPRGGSIGLQELPDGAEAGDQVDSAGRLIGTPRY